MRIAFACDGTNVSDHFGRCRSFRLYEDRDGLPGPVQEVPNAPEGHSAAISVLRAARVDAVIVGGIGSRAVELLEMAGIAVHPGASGSPDSAAKALLAGRFEAVEQVCSGHGHDGRHADKNGHECSQHGGASKGAGTCNNN